MKMEHQMKDTLFLKVLMNQNPKNSRKKEKIGASSGIRALDLRISHYV